MTEAGLFLKAMKYSKGITNRVSAVDTKIPKMSEMAKPLKMGSSKMKNAPIIAAKPVNTIGCARVMAEATTASFNATPCETCKRMKSTNKIELRTMMPAKAIMPIMDVAV